MNAKFHKSEHGSFNVNHVQAFDSLDDFINSCVGILNHLKKDEKKEALKKIYDACKPPKKKKSEELKEE